MLENLNHDEYKQVSATIEDNVVKSGEGPDKHEELHPGHRPGTLLPQQGQVGQHCEGQCV